jgi:hypothetical protein
MNRPNISRLLGALIFVGLVANWRLAPWTFRVQDPIGGLVGLTWLGLAIVSVVGLLRVRRWGAYCLLVLAPFSTIMLATPLFPGMHLVGLRGPVALVIWNLAALVSGVALLRMRDVPDAGSLTRA